MNFEKLKEWQWVAILGVIALGALLIQYIATISTRKGAEVLASINDGITNSAVVDDKLREKVSVEKYIKDINGKTLDDAQIQSGTYIIYGLSGDTIFEDEKIDVDEDNSKGYSLTGEKVAFTGTSLFKFIVPEKAITPKAEDYKPTGNTYAVFKLTDKGIAKKDDTSPVALKGLATKLSDAERGLSNNVLVGFGVFQDKDSADSFLKKYFPNGSVVQVKDTTKYLVLVKIGS